MVFLAAGLLLSFIYFILQTQYLIGWSSDKRVVIPVEFIPSTPLSVIIVAHNEENTIASTIKSVLQQQYPTGLFELIIIDDRSSDGTLAIAESFRPEKVNCLRLLDFTSFIHPPAFKKSGIELGVSQSSFDHIVITDADCTHDENWLKSIAFAFEQKQPVFMTGPVLINQAETPIERMQQLELLALALITGSGYRSKIHALANGANMAFKKSAFYEVGGYSGNYHHASGDDLFLAEKMQAHLGGRSIFLKSNSSLVYTHAKRTWHDLYAQRIRWAAKNKGLRNNAIHWIWSFVGTYHFAILALLFLGIFSRKALIAFLIMAFIKMMMDALVFISAKEFFKIRIRFSDIFLLQFLYMRYMIGLGMRLASGKKGDWG